MYNKLYDRGFTLIELLITLVIVAVISSFALPALNNSMIQSRVTDMLTAVEPLKRNIEGIIASNESTNIGSILTVPASLGPNVANVAVNTANGVITLTGTPSAGSVVLTITPNFDQTHGTVQWTCKTSNAFTALVPPSCQ